MGTIIRNGIEYGGGSSVELDATLSIEGKAADAQAVGDTKISYTDVVDNLESTATDLPLSANQGKILNEKMLQIVSFDTITGTLITKSSDYAG